MAAQTPAHQPDRLMGKLSLGDRALPKLTDAFPQTHSAAFCGGGSSCRGAGSMRLSAHVAAEDVSWRDREAMKAKYAPQSAWQPRSRKLDVKFCNIRKVVPLFSLKDASFLHDTPFPRESPPAMLPTPFITFKPQQRLHSSHVPEVLWTRR
jgi:hypothetical protein